VTLQDAVRTVLGKYADFSGRARRSEYWYWVLALVLAEIVCGILFGIVKPLGYFLYVVLFLASIVPSLAVGWRRLHDTGKSGWWILISLVPFVGGIILIVFMVQDSQPGVNEYGPSPKEVPAAA
jgi:uncharacterized membrane protein YhaH (DUF805 family)